MKKVVIQGLGFVGSATAVAIASKLTKSKKPLFNVYGVDLPNKIGKHRVDELNKGRFPFKTVDTQISKEAKKAYLRNNLKTTHSNDVYIDADIVIVSVNYDLDKVNKRKINLLDFKKSCEIIAKKINQNTLVIVQSTVAPGTCEKIIYPIFKKNLLRRKIDIDTFWLAHSYERVMPGKDYLNSIINYWRVYSGINKASAKKCKEFLSHLINVKKYPLTELESTTASETAKILENSYRAVNIAFIEEWSRFAEDIGIDLFNVISAIRKRPTHSNIMQPGFGVGGYCLTKDPLFAKAAAKQIFNLDNHDFTFSSSAVKINNLMPIVTLDKLSMFFGKNIKNKNILLMGISYREEISDTRHSPSEIFYKKANKLGLKITPQDPLVNYWEETKLDVIKNIPDFAVFDAIIFAVNNKEYKKINFKSIKRKSKKLLIFDSNNVLSLRQINQIKCNRYLDFISIGRG